ncbi:MAG: glycosyltransferase, partial [Clostridia bacterium]|nr:glycosyltransferase [Clostridia bacterium]
HFYKGAPKLNWMLYYPVEKWLARYTDALITINKEDYELAGSKLTLRGGGKVYYVPGVGIDKSAYKTDADTRAAKREELGIPQNAFVIISAGELNANKNNRAIISAMKRAERKDVHYVLCGVGDMEVHLQKQAEELSLSDRVHFIGYRKDIKELYKMSDCFVMPSYREGLSRSMMEAMASGLPCIASKIRGNTDLLEEGGGFLCEADDIEAYAQKIDLLAGDSLMRAAMGKKNLEVIEKFSTENVTQAMLKIYEAELK